MTLQRAIKKKLIKLIKDNKLTANKLALMAGVSRSSINKFLRNQSKSIKLETLALICEALNISLAEFFDDSLFNNVEIDN